MRSERILQALGESGARLWRAPGRVNIVGEHVDYTGGLVLPFACDLEVLLACVPRPGAVDIESLDGLGRAVVSLSSVSLDGGWARYVAGVLTALREAGLQPSGVRGVLTSTIPIGAGLSSSAALAAAVALAVTSGRPAEPELLQRAEHLAVGVPCGIMDQVAVLRGVEGSAILLDCRTMRTEQVPLPSRVGFVVLDTGTRRALDDGRYAARAAEAGEGIAAACARLAATHVRELNARDVADAGLPPVPARRVRHVVGENLRVELAVAALRAGDTHAVGAILDESHRSLRDDFEVSSPVLDLAVDVARELPGCLGARLVGAGFAGCALAVVDAGSQEQLILAWQDRVAGRLPGARAFAVQAVAGAGEVLG